MTRVNKFFRILKLELLDMQDDLETVILSAEKKRDAGEYTEYVLRENTALYRNEINALADFIHETEERERENYASVEDAIASIKEMLPGKVKTWNYPALMSDLLSRKMDKILSYIDISS